MADLINAFAELSQFELDPAAIRKLPLAFCQRNRVVILGTLASDPATPVTVGMLDTTAQLLVQRISALLHRPIEPVRLNVYEINKAIQIGFSTRKECAYSVNVAQVRGQTAPPQGAPAHLDRILAEAVARRASDIHIESYLDDVDLRFRLDGILHQVFTHLNPDNVTEVVNRIKILAEMDITERRRPQDGRFSVTFIEQGARRTIDFRASVLPSVRGEDVVLRVLDSDIGLVGVDMLGMGPEQQEVFTQILTNPEGLVLVTGPTGSGKTTTLYAALAHINDGQRKIITAEDPIEYYIPKINQKQLSQQMGLDDLLRAMLRQDPDVLLVGEIRDRPTGQTAIMASATGHVVLGTLHTSDAVGAVMRLRGLGLDDRDVAGTLLAVIGQRLVRALCPLCSQPAHPTEEEEHLFGPLLDGVQVFQAVGCERCYGTGYQGRIGLFELLYVDQELQELISQGVGRSVVLKQALRKGFKTMVDDGLEKVRAGITTLDELRRVVPLRAITTIRHERAPS
ncbi:MAG: general secretion pathway protein GspE [Myxococcales bacterium]|nr:general secretion pathway protein GspE [Myxococcales bacterium]